MKSNSAPFERFLFRFFSMVVGSNLLEWQMQNNLLPLESTAPGDHCCLVKSLFTSCQPGMQQRCVQREKMTIKLS